MLENKLVDPSVYYKPRNRLGAFAIGISSKRLGSPVSGRESAVKKAQVQRISKGEGFSSATTKFKNKNFLVDSVLNNEQNPDADTSTTVLNSPLRKYFLISNAHFKNYRIISSSTAGTSK